MWFQGDTFNVVQHIVVGQFVVLTHYQSDRRVA